MGGVVCFVGDCMISKKEKEEGEGGGVVGWVGLSGYFFLSNPAAGGEERRERRGFRSSPPNLESDFHQSFDKI